ncbi:mechanosensitive ion channel family protein [Silvibacterium sp.]|uniref:mechanosensitive ion channel family protein n=1 Tax=Silvibacterium sp. TaxID=1964179 RepID=UPI0039E616DE
MFYSSLFAHHRWFFVIFAFCAALFLGNLGQYLFLRFLKHSANKNNARIGWGLQKHLGGPSRAIFLLTCFLVSLQFIPRVPQDILHTIRHGTYMILVLAVGWFFSGCVYVLQDFMLRRYDVTVANNIRARRIHTQFQLFRRIAIGFVIVLTAGTLLWTFDDPKLWHYGSGLLASAGLASLLLASAAKTTVSNLLAGLQIALTEPIRIDDVVVVSGEWARVEEITSSYVVLKIWDLRRLIVPLSWFIENPFANWTRESANILTYSYLYLDYEVPVKELRAQFERVLDGSKQWDRGVKACQVTNLTDRSMEIRCLMGAPDSSQAFDLQCLVREEMMDWVREHYPSAFPTARFSAPRDISVKAPEDLLRVMQSTAQQPETPRLPDQNAA